MFDRRSFAIEFGSKERGTEGSDEREAISHRDEISVGNVGEAIDGRPEVVVPWNRTR